MNRKILTLLTAASFALFFGACGDDNSASSNGPEISCLDTDDCLDEDLSSADDEPSSSSSKKGDAKSSSSVKDSKDENKSSSSAKEDKDEDKSSSSEAKDDKSSDSKSESSNSKGESSDSKGDSSSSETQESSSSEEPASSSSEEVKPIEYANTTPNLADLEVSGDTLFAVFQRADANFSFNHNGLLVMFKLSDGSVLDTIQLAAKNPVAVKSIKGQIYVASQSPYPYTNTSECGIEKIDLSNKTSSLHIKGTSLGGCPSDFVVDTKNNKGFATAYVNYGEVYINEIDLASSSVKKINLIKDASGGLEFDEASKTLYIGDRFIDWSTYDMHIGVFAYKGGIPVSITEFDEEDIDAGIEEMRTPYSIKVVDGKPYVVEVDPEYKHGALYLNYSDPYDDNDGIDFSSDTKLAVVNNQLFVMDRVGSSSIAKIDIAKKNVAWQSITSGKNPYDMVAASATTAWVAYYDTPTLELISTSNGSSVKLIDTKEFCAVKIDAAED